MCAREREEGERRERAIQVQAREHKVCIATGIPTWVRQLLFWWQRGRCPRDRLTLTTNANARAITFVFFSVILFFCVRTPQVPVINVTRDLYVKSSIGSLRVSPPGTEVIASQFFNVNFASISRFLMRIRVIHCPKKWPGSVFNSFHVLDEIVSIASELRNPYRARYLQW